MKMLTGRLGSPTRNPVWSSVILTSVAIALALALLLLVVAFGHSEERAAAMSGRPSADYYTAVSSPVASLRNPADVPAEAIKIADVHSSWSSYSLFSWDHGPTPGRGVPSEGSCVGYFRLDSVSASCTVEVDSIPDVSSTWGSTEATPCTTIVTNAPAGGEWLVVTTSTGTRAVANLIEDVGLTEWPADHGMPLTVGILDSELNELWSFSY